MKKMSFFAMLCLFCGAANAQFYLNANIGYAIPAAGQTISGAGVPYSGTASATAVFSVKDATFSSGIQCTAGVGYLINDHLGVQLDALVGLVTKQYSYTDYGVNVYYGSSASPVLSDVTYKLQAATPVVLSPSLMLQTGGKVWNIYSRFGVALPVNTAIDESRIFSNAPNTGAHTVTEEKWQFTSYFSPGYTAAAGVSRKMSGQLSLRVEVSTLSLSAYVKQQDLTGYIRNGQSYNIAQLSGNKTYYYSKSGTEDTDFVHRPTYSQPFSNIAFNIGIQYTLSQRHTHSAMKHETESE
jgi:hypothetical protein